MFSDAIAGDIALVPADWGIVAPDGTVMAECKSTESVQGYMIDFANGQPKLT